MADAEKPTDADLPNYRPELRGLALGLIALVFRGLAGVLLMQAMGSKDLEFAKGASGAAALSNFAAMAVALAGVGYAAIAAHRRRWGGVLVMAWLFSVLAVFGEIQPFAFASL